MSECPIIYSRSKIEKLIYSNKIDPKYAYISIYGTNEKQVKYPSYIRHISLCMDDLKATDLDKPEEYHLEDFKRIANFIIRSINDGFLLVCQCESGVSRSVGIAMAISKWSGRKDNIYLNNNKYMPNTLFYELTLKALEEITFRRKIY